MRPQVDREGLVEFTRRLVRIESVNRPADGSGEAEAAAAVAEQARAFGWTPVVEEVAPGRPNVVVWIDGGRPGPVLMFEGHTDVVTAGDRSEWTRDPFGAEVAEGKIFGRGAADMKGGLAAMMFAARAVEQSGDFPGTILLAVLCDEEEMMIGVQDFIGRGHAHGVDGAIVCEPEGGELCLVQKGAMRLLVEVEGKMAHGAMPHLGRNPILAIAPFLSSMWDLQRELQGRHGEHPHLGQVLITPTHLDAGSVTQLNVIPAVARLTLDIRTVPGLEHRWILDRIGALADDIGSEREVSFEIVVLDDRPATETPESHPLVNAVVEAHREVTGRRPPFGGVPGTTDGTILWRDAGIPVVVYGPGDKWIAHQADEYVAIDDLFTAADVYVAAALRFLGA